jgi:hypothetical protein
MMPNFNLLEKETEAGVPAPALAGGQGFEPQLTDPKSVVLPLDDPPSATKSRDLGPSGAETQT